MRLIRTEYTIENGKPIIYFFTRDKDGKRQIINSNKSTPYFYVSVDEVDKLNNIKDSVKIDPGIYEDVYGKFVKKIYVNLPKDVAELRDYFSNTWEADVPYTNRCTIDEIESIEPASPRIMMIDIETNNSGRVPNPMLAPEAIIAITAYTDTSYTTFVHRTDIGEGVKSGMFKDCLHEVHYFRDEVQMLEAFIDFCKDEEPDILSGWNCIAFDMPYIVNRMKRLGLRYDKLSPMKSVYIDDRTGEVRIRGLAIIDLMGLYKQNSQTQEPSYSLDAIGKKELGEGKIGIGANVKWMWTYKLEELINYNSVHGQTKVPISKSSDISIEKLFKKYSKDKFKSGKQEIIDTRKYELSTFAVDENGQVKTRRINKVIRHQCNSNDLLRVTLESGRFIDVTPNHSIVTWNNNLKKIDFCNTISLTKNDKVVILDDNMSNMPKKCVESCKPFQNSQYNCKTDKIKISPRFCDIGRNSEKNVNRRKWAQRYSRNNIKENCIYKEALYINRTSKKKLLSNMWKINRNTVKKMLYLQRKINIRGKNWKKTFSILCFASKRYTYTNQYGQNSFQERVCSNLGSQIRERTNRFMGKRKVSQMEREKMPSITERRESIHISQWFGKYRKYGQSQRKNIQYKISHQTREKVIRYTKGSISRIKNRNTIQNALLLDGPSNNTSECSNTYSGRRMFLSLLSNTLSSTINKNTTKNKNLRETCRNLHEKQRNSSSTNMGVRNKKESSEHNGENWKNGSRTEYIKSIEPISSNNEIIYVYDLEVEECHTFLGNGIFVHNTNDVYICVALDRKKQLLEFLDEMRRLCYCQFEDCTTITRMADTFILRMFHGRKVFPSKRHDNKVVEYEGAIVESKAGGLYENVAVYDIKSLYPSIVVTANLSPESMRDKAEPGTIQLGRCHVNQDVAGYLPEVIGYLFKERTKYKNLRDKEEYGTDNYKIYNMRQESVKRMLNALYGQTAYPKSRFYDPRVAETITWMGRQTITWSKDYVRSIGYKVIYLDTDSLHIVFDSPDIEQMLVVLSLINESYDEFVKQFGFTTHNFEIQFEKLYRKVFYNKDTKKRYAGALCWKDGKPIDILDIWGFETRRSDASELTRRLLTNIFDMVLRQDKSKTEVMRYIGEEIHTIRSGKFHLNDIGIPKGISKEPTEYCKGDFDTTKPVWEQKGLPANIRGALYTTQSLGYELSNKPKLIYVSKMPEGFEPIDVICFDDESQVPAGMEIDVEKMLDRTIRSKISPIFNGLKWRMDELVPWWRGKAPDEGKQERLFSLDYC